MSKIEKKSPTELELHPLIANRWSPRIFDPSAKMDEHDLVAILEAARMAPSAFNEQPWRYLIGRRDDSIFTSILNGLSEFNQAWARNSSALILVCAKTRRANGDPIKTYKYDLGLSVSQAGFEAHHRGFFAHHMAGFDPKFMVDTFQLEDLEPVVVVALGRLGDVERHSEQEIERERTISTRRPLSEIVLKGLDA